MDMFYENRNITDEIFVKREKSHLFPAHFHLSLEIFLLAKGEYVLTLNGEKVRISSGDIFIADSYDVHSYDEQNSNTAEENAVVVILPYKYLAKFNAERKGFKLKTPVVHNEKLCRKLIEMADEYFQPDKSEQIKSSATELFLALLCEELQFSDEKTGEEEVLIRSILAFVQENYKGEVPLSKVARHLGYSEAHISRAFHKYIKMSLPEYVNRLRLEYVSREKAKDSRRKMVDLVYEAGFKSQQSYYRWKEELK